LRQGNDGGGGRQAKFTNAALQEVARQRPQLKILTGE
jgi:hypothetical protein